MDRLRATNEPKIFLFALILGFYVGVQGIALLPFWMGIVVDNFAVNERTAGGLATLQLGILAVASLLLSVAVHRVNRKRFIQIGISLSVFGNILSIYAFSTQSLTLLFFARAITGAGEGITVATISALAAGTANPIRTFAYLNGSMAIIAGIVFLSSPILVEYFAASGFFGIMLFAGLLAVGYSRYITEQTTIVQKTEVDWNLGLRSWLVLLLFGLFATVTGGVWAFAERIGTNSVDLTLQTIGIFIAIAAFTAPLGPVLANYIGTQYGRALPVTCSIVLYMGVAFAFGFAINKSMFLIGTIGHALVAVFATTYLSAFFAYLDPSGRVAAASPAFNSVGNALGPTVMAYALSFGTGYQALGWTAVILLSIVLVGLLPILRQSDKEEEALDAQLTSISSGET